MADRFDVAPRLADGRPAVEHTQSYVWACHVLGYQHPDLTMHDSQVRDWYQGEDGLDLQVLDGDCAALWSAVTTIEEALRTQRAQLTELAAAWTGPGADCALGFLQRHCEAADTVTANVRAAAEGCGALRDTLWQIIDRKVATAIAIDDRSRLERPAWLAAAATVTAGLAAQSPACGKLVDQQVKPYVDNDIRTDWLTAMRSIRASVAASYDAIVDGLAAAPATPFQIPGGLGLSCPPPVGEPASPAVPTITAPVAPPSASALSSSPADTVTADAAEPAPAPLDPVPLCAVPAPPIPAADGLAGYPPTPATVPATELGTAPDDLGDLPAGMGNLGGLGDLGNLGGVGGLGGLIGRIAETIGGLLGSLTEGLAGRSTLDGLAGTDDPFVQADNPFEQSDDRPDNEADDEEADDEEADDEGADDQPDSEPGGVKATARADADDSDPGTPGESPPATEHVDEEQAQDASTPPTDAPQPAGAPATAGAAPPPEPGSDGSTPCEIAADELPQAGQ